MQKHDIVYMLKNDAGGPELHYSLRSLKNFKHDRVVFYGGCPDGLKPDLHVNYIQSGLTKWDRVRNMLVDICSDDNLTEQFWLFNDDFYCMKPTEWIPPYYNGTLYERIFEIEKKHRRTSAYSKKLRQAADLLDSSGLGVLNYAVHMPMLIDRARALTVLEEFPDCPMFRSLYGNSCDVGGIDRKDVKIYTLNERPSPDADWLSTTDTSFRYGYIGRYIREQFPEVCEYER